MIELDDTFNNSIRVAVAMIKTLDMIVFYADRLVVSVEVELPWAARWGNPASVEDEGRMLAYRAAKTALVLEGAMEMFREGEYEESIVKRFAEVSSGVGTILCRVTDLLSDIPEIKRLSGRAEMVEYGADREISVLKNAVTGFVATAAAIELLFAEVRKLCRELMKYCPQRAELFDEISASYPEGETRRRSDAISPPKSSEISCRKHSELMLPDGSLLQHETFIALEDYEFVGW